jgi:arylsulfatase A-like enzyme
VPASWRQGRFPLVVLVFFATMFVYMLVAGLNLLASIGLSRTAKFVFSLGLASALCRSGGGRFPAFLKMARYGIPLVAGIVFLWGGGREFACWESERRLLAEIGPPPPGKPNVLLVVWDTVRARNLSVYGYQRPTAPVLARLAARSVVFDHAIATAPWTLPSHAGMFTGRYLHDLPNLESAGLPASSDTLAEVLYRQGYLTAGFAANYLFCHRYTGLAKGFVHYEDYPASIGSLVDYPRLVHGLWDDLYPLLPKGRFLKEPARRSAETINREFLAWRDRCPRRPFFAFLNYFDAHFPYSPQVFDTPDYPDRANRILSAASSDAARRAGRATELTDEERRVALEAYDRCVAYMDRQLGLLLAGLERRGELENTLVIITADHGEEFGEHGDLFHGTNLYEPQTHVPLLICLPGREGAGQHVLQTVSLGDLANTVLDVLRVEESPLPGQSLARYWRPGRPGTPSAAPVLAEVNKPRFVAIPGHAQVTAGNLRAVWCAGEKYIYQQSRPGKEELYDLDADPEECRNLAGTEAFHPSLDRLRNNLARLERATPSQPSPVATRPEKPVRPDDSPTLRR